VQDPQTALAGGDELDVVGRDGRRVDHGVGALEVGRLVGAVYRAAERGERGQRRPLPQFAAGHRDLAGQQQPREAAHADAADADQVHPTEILRGKRHPETPLSKYFRSASSPSRRPYRAAAALIPASRAPSRTSGTTVLVTHSGERSLSSTIRPPPAL